MGSFNWRNNDFYQYLERLMDWGALVVGGCFVLIFWVIDGFVDRICEKIDSVGDRIGRKVDSIESELRDIRSQLNRINDL